MTEFNNFIAKWDDAIPLNFCDFLIEQFETAFDRILINKPNVKENKNMALSRNDQSYILNYHNEYAPMVYDALKTALAEYVDEYQQLAEVPLIPSEIKMQKTPPGGGFHVWHYESAGWEVSQRELTWMFYLNDIPDGEGETEFLYQRVRYKPKKGSLLIWPAGMTHVHRGNTMLTCDKYILTGWFIKAPTR